MLRSPASVCCFEEAIRKVEADLTHRPPSATGVSTPLPPATQCPQQKFDQGGLPMRPASERSPEGPRKNLTRTGACGHGLCYPRPRVAAPHKDRRMGRQMSERAEFHVRGQPLDGTPLHYT